VEESLGRRLKHNAPLRSAFGVEAALELQKHHDPCSQLKSSIFLGATCVFKERDSTMAGSTSEKLLLWNHPASPYAQKIRIALREKGLPFTAETPNGLGAGMANATYENFSAGNPRIEVPFLVDGDVKIFDSSIIFGYIEDKWPQPALMPSRTSPADRAEARMIEEMCDTQYEGINWGLGSEINWFKRATGQKAEQMKEQAAHQTKQMLGWLSAKLGNKDWFVGDSFSWADICVIPYLHQSVVFGLGPPTGSSLVKWYNKMMQRPSVSTTLTEFPPDWNTKDGRNVVEALKSGQFKREYRDHRLEWMIKSGGIDIVVEGLKNNNIRFCWPTAKL
jgi:glutathione S-transferase